MDRPSLKAYAPMAPTDEGALDPNSPYAHILQFVNGPKRILDFGCGPGNLARFLSQRGCTVVGVEINPESAALAKEYCEDVIVADLDAASLIKLFPSDRFDIVVFADILEHLRDPGRVLKETHQLLRAGGFVAASIPNIAHGAIRLSMLKGDFDYQETGIMDNTHLRFFTHKTVVNMFATAGFSIDEMTRTEAPVFEPSESVPVVLKTDFPDAVVRDIESDPEGTTLQFVIKAVPISAVTNRDGSLKSKNALLESRLAETEQQVRRLQAKLRHAADVEADAKSWEEHRRELTEQIAAFQRANEQWVAYRTGLERQLELATDEAAHQRLLREVMATNNRALTAELAALRRSFSELDGAAPSASSVNAPRLRDERLDATIAEEMAALSDAAGRAEASLRAEIARLIDVETELRERVLERQVSTDQVTAERNQLLAEREQLLTEREQLFSDRAALAGQANAASEQVATLCAEIARLLGVERELRERILERQLANEQAQAERDRAITDQQNAAKLLDEMGRSKIWKLRNAWVAFKKAFRG